MPALVRSVFTPVALVLALAAAPAAVAWAAAPDRPAPARQQPTSSVQRTVLDTNQVRTPTKPVPALGKKHLYGPGTVGFGTRHPRHVFNGGDPSGNVTKVAWKDWGSGVTTGHGLGYAYRPGGGYYRKHVTVQFRAGHLGHCTQNGPLAYTVLRARFQKKPGSSQWSKWIKWGGLDTICSTS